MRKIIMMTALMLALFAASGEAYAQWNQNDACPGWNNPSNFSAQFLNDTGGYTNCWSGQNGEVPTGGTDGCDNCTGNDHYGLRPNVLTSTLGVTLSTPVYTGNALANVEANAGYGGSNLPNNAKQFAIMTTTSQASGSPVNRDPNTGNQLKFVPDQFNTNDTTGQIINTNITRTIRIGDGKAEHKAAALYYELIPTTENAIFIIYYAIVVETPEHGLCCDPAMVIRVMERNTANTAWVQKSDTLAYYITSTPSSMGCGSVNIGQGGWASTGGYGAFYYKQWSKVVLNLSDCLYQRTRIEIIVRDCCYSAHTAYAYVAGECREMNITSSGCPAGMSTAVTKLSAPRGMLNYEWSASNFGVAQPVTTLNPGGTNSYFSFRTLSSGTEAQGHADYNVQAADFRVMRRPSPTGDTVALADSVGNLQTFRCMMTSAIDPSKPFKTPLYVNVQNTKPLMAVDTVVSCDGSISIKNLSQVPGDPTLVVDSTTTYSFYDNTIGEGEPYAVLTGDSVTHFFNSHTDYQSYVVRTNTQDPTCYSEALYLTTPLRRPNAGFTSSKHVLCDADETTLTDTTSGVSERWWTFLTEDSPAITDSLESTYDTVYGQGTQNIQFSRGFSHGTEPIELIVRNGMYYIDTLVEGDTVWCEDRAYDTVSVFLHPDLEVTGDIIVCEGSQTNAVVRALGVDGCTFEWSRTYGSITGGIPQGDTLRVVPYADTATYYVRVTSPQGCVAWDSVQAFLVKPQLTMSPADGRICPGQTATLTGLSADHYTWSASPADSSLAGQDSNAVIHVSPTRNTVYTMIGHGSNDCDALPLTKTVTILPPPVPKVNASPSYVDSEDPTVTLTDVSTYGVASHWRFSNGEESVSRTVQHTFDEAIGSDSVYGDLTSYNELGCPSEYRFSIPVKLFTAWFPNAFTPGSEDENSRFRLYSVNVYEYFHIYIYNRQGMIVYSSDDPAFEWDGTKDGEPCDQGAYVYVCNYRKPGTQTLKSLTGTITLIR